jgi:cbb3-type cytochrome oxidase subunit 3
VGMQSQMIAMLDTFKLITVSYFFMAPLVLLLRKAGRTPAAPAASME